MRSLVYRIRVTAAAKDRLQGRDYGMGTIGERSLPADFGVRGMHPFAILQSLVLLALADCLSKNLKTAAVFVIVEMSLDQVALIKIGQKRAGHGVLLSASIWTEIEMNQDASRPALRL